MGFWTEVQNKFPKRIQATEGAQANILLESILTATALNSSGTENAYKNYSAQTTAIYRKYNGRDSLGNWQLRAIIDTRSSFIAGEGISVIANNEKTSEFLEKVLRDNRYHGSRFFDNVKTGEIEGRVLNVLKPDKERSTIKISRYNSSYCGGYNYEVFLKDKSDISTIDSVVIKKGESEETLKDNFIFTRLGGDPSKINETTTKCGLVLNNIDCYDRGLNAMRKNNHLFAKVTPFGSFENQQDVTSFKKLVETNKWKIGDAFAAVNAKMNMIVPDIGAMENIKAELLANAKAISFVTGIPMHWTGWVDAMSNRSTADSLYETINNATILERNTWEESLYEMFVMAQELAIDSGIISGTIDYDFEVKIPLIPFYKLLDRIKALSMAFADDAISMQDYRNALPGINPYITGKMTESDIDKALSQLKIDGSETNGEDNNEKE